MKALFFVSYLVIFTAVGIIGRDIYLRYNTQLQAASLIKTAQELSCKRIAIPAKYRVTVRNFLAHEIVPYLYQDDSKNLSSTYYGNLLFNGIVCLVLETDQRPDYLFAENIRTLDMVKTSQQISATKEWVLHFNGQNMVKTDLAPGHELAINYSRPYGYTPLGAALSLPFGQAREFFLNLTAGDYVLEVDAFSPNCAALDLTITTAEQTVAAQRFKPKNISRRPERLLFTLKDSSEQATVLNLRSTSSPSCSENKKLRSPSVFIHRLIIRRAQ